MLNSVLGWITFLLYILLKLHTGKCKKYECLLCSHKQIVLLLAVTIIAFHSSANCKSIHLKLHEERFRPFPRFCKNISTFSLLFGYLGISDL